MRGLSLAEVIAIDVAILAGEKDEALWGSRGDGVAEVSRRFGQPVMGNAHRVEYVEALLALALRHKGWTRGAPWEARHFENQSGVRLKLKLAVAMQSWGNRETGDAPHFDSAFGKVSCDEKEGRCYA